MVLEGKPERESAKIGKWDKWRENIAATLAECIQNGYHTGKSQTDKKSSQAITRAELQKAIRREES
jgi:Zn ribbon nucleic-acid-binding protein